MLVFVFCCVGIRVFDGIAKACMYVCVFDLFSQRSSRHLREK